MAQALDCPAIGFAGYRRRHDSLPEIALEGLDRTGRPDLVVLKSHQPIGDFERLDRSRIKLVSIVRDPRDILVSGMHYFFKGKPDADKKMLRRMQGSLGFRSWQQYVDEFQASSCPIVRYEDLLLNTEKELARLLTRAGLDFCLRQLKTAVHDQSFEVARSRYRKTGELHKLNHARSGTIGGHRHALSVEMIERVNREMSASMSRLGYASAASNILDTRTVLRTAT
ncbi:sulfotransferase domain-containing protein [Hoeflea sp. TYP-13]|uniref:sulfotransferase domain-containing protein n=1 Tax=Hoeflea sp. TYP-13 TaxID=3230023 RepID=UPI0034C5E40E